MGVSPLQRRHCVYFSVRYPKKLPSKQKVKVTQHFVLVLSGKEQKINLAPRFSFSLLKTYILKFCTDGHDKRTIHWKLLINVLAKRGLLANWWRIMINF